MSMERPLRVGFIGTGWADRVQIPAFKLGGLQPWAIASGNVENARRTAEKHQIPEIYEEWRALVESATVDVVSITAPPAHHCEMAVAALQAGKHVICEKPAALNASEAERMLAAAQAAPGQLALIDHELRFTPQCQTIRRLFRDNYVGWGIWIEMTWRSAHRLNPELPWNWWSEAEQGGGVLRATGSHLLDLNRWMFGRIEALTAQLKTGHSYRQDPATGRNRQVTADDHAHIGLQFSNGMAGAITASAIAPGKPGMTLTLYGTDGALRLDEDDRLWGMRGEAVKSGDWMEIPVIDTLREAKHLPAQTSFARGSIYLAQAIAHTLAEGHHWLTDAANFYDGVKAQQLLDAAQQSHQNRAWIQT